MQPLPDGEMPSDGGGAPSGRKPDSDSSDVGGAASGGTGNQARVGISLGDLDEDQLAAFVELLAAATGTWEFQFGGHHLAVANTYTDGALAGATPSFRGLEPFGEFEYEGETIDVMAVKAEAFRALFAGPEDDQLASAELADTYVASSGSIEFTEQNDYIRVDGPSVWIELSLQSGIVPEGNHPHTVWPHRNTDYGGTQS